MSEQTFHNELENAILNFGNVIGAFIIYVLIESLRPNERKIPISDRHQILKDFLQNAINMSLVYTQFLRILPGNPDQIIMETDNESFEKITNAYSQVYPGFSELLDDSFRKYTKYNFDRDKSCDHEWRRVKIHKIGERFECRKCSGLVEEKDLEPETT